MKEYPFFADVVMIMGTARVIFKPLFALVDTVISTTPSQTDDAKWAEIKGSKVFSAMIFLVDYVASVKIPVKK